jgi:transcriptional regulator
MKGRSDLLQGSLDLLILKTLALEPLHGWAVSKRIQLLSHGVLEVNQGSLYPAIYRLRDRGLIESTWGESEIGRRVKVYGLTKKGRAALKAEQESWRRFSDAVEAILATGG